MEQAATRATAVAGAGAAAAWAVTSGAAKDVWHWLTTPNPNLTVKSDCIAGLDCGQAYAHKAEEKGDSSSNSASQGQQSAEGPQAQPQSQQNQPGPTPAPRQLPGFPGTNRVRPKTPVQGGGGLRPRWRDRKGNIYEWDSQHGTVEKYDKRGKHQGEFDAKTGKETKPADKKRRIEP